MPEATIRQAAILVGGRGSRLGDLVATTPKPLLPVGDRPHLAWVLRELCRYGVEQVALLAGARAPAFRAALPALGETLPRALAITVLDEPGEAGTAGALAAARGHLAERFLLLNGDTLFDANWAALLADAAADGPDVAARLLLQSGEAAGSGGAVTLAGDRVTRFAYGSNSVGLRHAGAAVLRREMLAGVPPVASLERDVFPHLATAGRLRGTAVEGWLVDIGTPAGLARARVEVPARFGRRPALIFDRDGVLNVDHGYVGHRERFEWTPTAKAAVRAVCERGWHVFLATNQSGVARGLYDEDAVRALYDWMRGELHRAGATIDDWRYCPTHPEGSVAAYAREDAWRKPAPGMLRDLLRAWRLDSADCLMVGDQPTDMQAAAAAGVAGHLFRGGDLLAFVSPLLDRQPAPVV